MLQNYQVDIFMKTYMPNNKNLYMLHTEFQGRQYMYFSLGVKVMKNRMHCEGT